MLRNMLPYKIKMSKKLKVMDIVLAVIITLIIIKVVWVACATSGLGDWDSERMDIIRRANYLTERVATSPQQLLNEMPSGIGEQFQGGALYTYSMTWQYHLLARAKTLYAFQLCLSW